MAKKILTKKDILDWAEEYGAEATISSETSSADNYCPPRRMLNSSKLKSDTTNGQLLMTRVYCDVKITGVNGEDLTTPVTVANDRVSEYKIGTNPIKSISVNDAPFVAFSADTVYTCDSQLKVRDSIGAETLACELVFKPTNDNVYRLGRVTEGPIWANSNPSSLTNPAVFRVTVILQLGTTLTAVSSDYLHMQRDTAAIPRLDDSAFVLQWAVNLNLCLTANGELSGISFPNRSVQFKNGKTVYNATNADIDYAINGSVLEPPYIIVDRRTNSTYPITYRRTISIRDSNPCAMSVQIQTRKSGETSSADGGTIDHKFDDIILTIAPQTGYTVKAVICENYGRLCLIHSGAQVLYITNGHFSAQNEFPGIYFAAYENIYIGGDKLNSSGLISWDLAKNNSNTKDIRRLSTTAKVNLKENWNYYNTSRLSNTLWDKVKGGETLPKYSGNCDGDPDEEIKLFPFYRTGTLRQYLLSPSTSVQYLIDFHF